MIALTNDTCQLARPRRVPSKQQDTPDSVTIMSELAGRSWVDITAEQVAAWKDEACSLYLNWVLCDMALDRLLQSEAQSGNALDLFGFRADRDVFRRIKLASLNGPAARLRHDHARDMILRLSIGDLIGFIEACLCDARVIFLTQNAGQVVSRPEHSGLKRLYDMRLTRPKAWDRAWAAYLRAERDEIQRQGMPRLVPAYWEQAQLCLPNGYASTPIDQLGATFQLFSEIRTALTQRSAKVSPALAAASTSVGCRDLAFEADAPFSVTARHMEVIEGFFHEYLDVLDRALAAASESSATPQIRKLA